MMKNKGTSNSKNIVLHNSIKLINLINSNYSLAEEHTIINKNSKNEVLQVTATTTQLFSYSYINLKCSMALLPSNSNKQGINKISHSVFSYFKFILLNNPHLNFNLKLKESKENQNGNGNRNGNEIKEDTRSFNSSSTKVNEKEPLSEYFDFTDSNFLYNTSVFIQISFAFGLSGLYNNRNVMKLGVL